MITKEKIDRINTLAHKKKLSGLTEAEKEEQQILRREYIDSFKANLKAQLDRIEIVDGTPDDASLENAHGEGAEEIIIEKADDGRTAETVLKEADGSGVEGIVIKKTSGKKSETSEK